MADDTALQLAAQIEETITSVKKQLLTVAETKVSYDPQHRQLHVHYHVDVDAHPDIDLASVDALEPREPVDADERDVTYAVDSDPNRAAVADDGNNPDDEGDETTGDGE